MSNHSMCCTTHTTYTTSSPTNSSSGSQEAMPATGKSCREKVMAMLLPFLQALPVPAESKLCQHGLQPRLWLQRREQASGDLGHILSQGSNLAGSEHYCKCKDRKHGTYWDFPVAWPGPVWLPHDHQLQPPKQTWQEPDRGVLASHRNLSLDTPAPGPSKSDGFLTLVPLATGNKPVLSHGNALLHIRQVKTTLLPVFATTDTWLQVRIEMQLQHLPHLPKTGS